MRFVTSRATDFEDQKGLGSPLPGRRHGREARAGRGMTPLAPRPAAPADSEFCYQLHKAAMGGYITAIWGWDEQVQRGFHSRAFNPARCFYSPSACQKPPDEPPTNLRGPPLRRAACGGWLCLWAGEGR